MRKRPQKKASLEAEDKIEAWREAVESGKSAEEIQKLNKAVIEAKNNAVKSGRKAAKLSAVSENLVETARRMGADLPEEEPAENAEE